MPDYDDGLVTAVAKALAEVPIHSTSRLYLDRSDANDAARAAIAAVLEWQGKQPTITIPVCVPHNVRLAIARSIGKSIDETNHMVRADLAYHAMLDAYRLAP